MKLLRFYLCFTLLFVTIATSFSLIRHSSVRFERPLSLSTRAERIGSNGIRERARSVGKLLFGSRPAPFAITRVATLSHSHRHTLSPTVVLCHCGSERYYFLINSTTGRIGVIAPASHGAKGAPAPHLSYGSLSQQSAIVRAGAYLAIIRAPVLSQVPVDVYASIKDSGERQWVLTYRDRATEDYVGISLALSAVDGRFISYWDSNGAFEPS